MITPLTTKSGVNHHSFKINAILSTFYLPATRCLPSINCYHLMPCFLCCLLAKLNAQIWSWSWCANGVISPRCSRCPLFTPHHSVICLTFFLFVLIVVYLLYFVIVIFFVCIITCPVALCPFP